MGNVRVGNEFPESKFYPGLNGPFERHVCVYVPAQYVAGTASGKAAAEIETKLHSDPVLRIRV